MAGYPQVASKLILATALGLMGLGGCHAPPPVYIVQAAPQQLPVPTRPPEVQQEIRPSCPDEGWIWITGYWHWDGDEYQWVDGAWVPPRQGYSYYSANYLLINNQWMYQAAYWYPSHLPRPGGSHLGYGGHGSYQGHQGHQGHKGHTGSGTYGGQDTTPQGSDTPGKVRVSAPAANGQDTPGKVRVSAPPAPTGVDPDRRQKPPQGGPGDNKAGGAWTRKNKGQDKHLPAYDEDRRRRQIKPSRTNPVQVKVLKGHVDYRGTRKGRMVFSNIPDGLQRNGHGYPTDRTGAIILVPDKEKGDSSWKAAARVAPRGHRPDPVVVEVHSGDPKMKLRVRRSRPNPNPEAREKRSSRPRVNVDTRQRTHYEPATGQGSGARQQTVIRRPNTVHRRVQHQPQPPRVYRHTARPQPRPQPRRVNRPQPLPQPRRVVHRPTPRPQPRRVVHRPTPRPQPRRVHRPAPRPQPRPVAAPPKKRQRRSASPPPPPKERKPRKRKRR